MAAPGHLEDSTAKRNELCGLPGRLQGYYVRYGGMQSQGGICVQEGRINSTALSPTAHTLCFSIVDVFAPSKHGTKAVG